MCNPHSINKVYTKKKWSGIKWSIIACKYLVPNVMDPVLFLNKLFHEYSKHYHVIECILPQEFNLISKHVHLILKLSIFFPNLFSFSIDLLFVAEHGRLYGRHRRPIPATKLS